MVNVNNTQTDTNLNTVFTFTPQELPAISQKEYTFINKTNLQELNMKQ